jgi:hypothetical protein
LYTVGANFYFLCTISITYVLHILSKDIITQEITDKYNDPDTGASVTDTQSFDGSGSRTIVCVGYEMPLGPLAVGFQGNYVLGKYMQDVSDGYGTQEVEVGTDGIQFMVNLGYRFGE